MPPQVIQSAPVSADLQVIDWKGLAAVSQQQQQNDLMIVREANRQSEATRAFADSHALLGQQIATSKAAMALSDVERRTAELQLSTGVVEAEAMAKKAAAFDTMRVISAKKTAFDSIHEWDNSEEGKELDRQQKALFASDSNGDVMSAFEAFGNINKLVTQKARAVARTKMELAAQKELNVGADIILPESLGGLLQKKYDVGIMRNVDITTTNEIPPGTSDEVASAIKMTANSTKSTPQPVLLSVPEMYQRLGAPQTPQDRAKISAFLYNNSAENQKAITAQKIKDRIGEDAFNGMNVPGMTYDPKAKIKVMIAGKEVETTEADLTEQKFKEAIIPKKVALNKVDLSGKSIADPVSGKPKVNADGTVDVLTGLLGGEIYASGNEMLDKGRMIRKNIGIAGENIVTSSEFVLKPVGEFLSGLFGSDGTPDVFAPVTERALTPQDVTALDLIDKDLKSVMHISKADPRNVAVVQRGLSIYTSLYARSLDIRKYGIEYVNAKEAKAASDANAKLAK